MSELSRDSASGRAEEALKQFASAHADKTSLSTSQQMELRGLVIDWAREREGEPVAYAYALDILLKQVLLVGTVRAQIPQSEANPSSLDEFLMWSNVERLSEGELQKVIEMLTLPSFRPYETQVARSKAIFQVLLEEARSKRALFDPKVVEQADHLRDAHRRNYSGFGSSRGDEDRPASWSSSPPPTIREQLLEKSDRKLNAIRGSIQRLPQGSLRETLQKFLRELEDTYAALASSS